MVDPRLGDHTHGQHRSGHADRGSESSEERMSGPTVEFVGSEEAMADMRRWADQVAPEVARATDSFARRVADLVAGKVPVASGALAASVDTGEDGSGAESGVTVSIGEGLRYAG